MGGQGAAVHPLTAAPATAAVVQAELSRCEGVTLGLSLLVFSSACSLTVAAMAFGGWDKFLQMQIIISVVTAAIVIMDRALCYRFCGYDQEDVPGQHIEQVRQQLRVGVYMMTAAYFFLGALAIIMWEAISQSASQVSTSALILSGFNLLFAAVAAGLFLLIDMMFMNTPGQQTGIASVVSEDDALPQGTAYALVTHSVLVRDGDAESASSEEEAIVADTPVASPYVLRHHSASGS